MKRANPNYHRNVGRIQQRAVDEYRTLFIERVRSILAEQEGVSLEHAHSLAADDVEQEWRKIEASRELMIQFDRGDGAARDFSIEQWTQRAKERPTA